MNEGDNPAIAANEYSVRNIFSPRSHSDSLNVPTGQNQLQNDFFRTMLTIAIAKKMNKPDG